MNDLFIRTRDAGDFEVISDVFDFSRRRRA
jgi:hypothetical protein